MSKLLARYTDAILTILTNEKSLSLIKVALELSSLEKSEDGKLMKEWPTLI
jgi:hypothetical protein